jgi:hypothetical protein
MPLRTPRAAADRLLNSVLEPLRWGRYRLNCPLTRAALREMPAQNLLYGLNISDRYKYVYVGNPKTGASSLKSALVKLELRGTGLALDFQDWKVFHNRDVSPLKKLTDLGVDAPLSFLVENSYRFVTFVRNPYTRLLSCHRDKILGNKPQKLKVLRLLGYSSRDWERPVSFEQFVKAVVRQTDYAMDPHWRSQTAQILHGVFEYSFMGRFERYSGDFAELFGYLGLAESDRPEVPHRNSTGRRGEAPGMPEYTQELQDLVYARYERDFRNFGYGYDLPQ